MEEVVETWLPWDLHKVAGALQQVQCFYINVCTYIYCCLLTSSTKTFEWMCPVLFRISLFYLLSFISFISYSKKFHCFDFAFVKRVRNPRNYSRQQYQPMKLSLRHRPIWLSPSLESTNIAIYHLCRHLDVTANIHLMIANFTFFLHYE